MRYASDTGIAVYPRVCGGTVEDAAGPAALQGLSPRMRGNLRDLGGEMDLVGSIPAYAGEPRAGMGGIGGFQVYPRVCGGTPGLRHAGAVVRGLSPRMRGNPVGGGFTSRRRRSIPAYAGEPTTYRLALGKRWSIPAYAGEPTTYRSLYHSVRVYPRVCGGTGLPPPKPPPQRGLSPRMRGNH